MLNWKQMRWLYNDKNFIELLLNALEQIYDKTEYSIIIVYHIISLDYITVVNALY